MKRFLVIFGLLVGAILQASLVPFLAVKGTAFNLLLALVLALVVLKSFRELWLGIVLTGLLVDFFSGLPFGLISLSLVAAAYSVGWLNENVFTAVHFWILAGLLALGVLLYYFFFIILNELFKTGLLFGWRQLAIETAFSFLVSLSLFYGAKKVLR